MKQPLVSSSTLMLLGLATNTSGFLVGGGRSADLAPRVFSLRQSSPLYSSQDDTSSLPEDDARSVDTSRPTIKIDKEPKAEATASEVEIASQTTTTALVEEEKPGLVTKTDIQDEEEENKDSFPSADLEETTMFNGDDDEQKSEGASVEASNNTEQPVEEDANSAGEFLEAIRDATVTGSMALLRVLRWTAANALTASLPEEERQVLLQRLQPNEGGASGPQAASETTVGNADDEPDTTETRGSVQEEIAMAVREQVMAKEASWELEKETLTKELEDAATARIENELAVQQQRLEEQRQHVQGQMQQSQARLERDIASLENQLNTAKTAIFQKEQETAALVAKAEEEARVQLAEKEAQVQAVLQEKQEEIQAMKQAGETSDSTTVADGDEIAAEEASQKAQAAAKALEDEKEHLKQVEEMLEKRKQQQLQLQKVEEDLRIKAQEIQKAKDEFERANQDVEKQQQIEVPHLSPREYRALSEEEKGALKVQREASGGTGAKPTEDHPVLGPVVADLGYKRLHLVPSGQLGTIAIWERQRTYRNNRAQSMAQDKEKTMNLGFPGIVCLHEDSTGKLSVLDGQHRIGMMQALKEKRNKLLEESPDQVNPKEDFIFNNVLVEVYPQPEDIEKADDHARQVFLEVNKAEPVKMVDMPGVASTTDRKIITEAVAVLEEQYPKMFSPSQRCRIPNVNVDNMRNNIYGANILERNDITSAKKLVDWLMIKNAALGDKYEHDDEKKSFVPEKAWKKASTLSFYMGLESSWLYD